jgi:hypothetical protein
MLELAILPINLTKRLKFELKAEHKSKQEERDEVTKQMQSSKLIADMIKRTKKYRLF